MDERGNLGTMRAASARVGRRSRTTVEAAHVRRPGTPGTIESLAARSRHTLVEASSRWFATEDDRRRKAAGARQPDDLSSGEVSGVYAGKRPRQLNACWREQDDQNGREDQEGKGQNHLYGCLTRPFLRELTTAHAHLIRLNSEHF